MRPRFWCPPTGRIALDAAGFLADSGGRSGVEQTLETYDEIDRHRCLVLLGEPGIGKTTELARALAASDERAYLVDLGAVAGAVGIHRAVVEAPAVAACRESDGELALFVDAVDEARAERGVLGRVLIAELADLPLERVRLRIACRTADWPATLTTRLTSLFGEAHEYELQPLTRADVAAIATDSGVDGDAFVTAVVERGAGPLARVPLTGKARKRRDSRGHIDRLHRLAQPVRLLIPEAPRRRADPILNIARIKAIDDERDSTAVRPRW